MAEAGVMTRYIRVSQDDVPPGKSALWLFVEDDHLCAGVLKRRCDGRMEHSRPTAGDTAVITVICKLIAERPSDDLYVVIDPPAFWPEPFPLLASRV